MAESARMCDTPEPSVQAYEVLGCNADFNGLYKFKGRFCDKKPVFEKEESNSAIFYHVGLFGGVFGGSGWSLAERRRRGGSGTKPIPSAPGELK